jgi:hypothetical protein
VNSDIGEAFEETDKMLVIHTIRMVKLNFPTQSKTCLEEGIKFWLS